MRISFLPNVHGLQDNILNKVVLAALNNLPSEKAFNYVHSLLENDSAAKLISSGKSIEILVISSLCFNITCNKVSFPNRQPELKAKVELEELSLKMLRVYVQKVLSFKVGERGVIANGRILGPFEDDEYFGTDDFSLLDQYSTSSYLTKITDVLDKYADEDKGNLYFFQKICNVYMTT